jgi:hypothetical protein
MKRLTAWSLPALLLLIVVGCSKDDSLVTGPVANDQQQKKVDKPPAIMWEGWQNLDWTSLRAPSPVVKSYPALPSKMKLAKTMNGDVVVMSEGFENGFAGWTTVATLPNGSPGGGFPGHSEWAWYVGQNDPYTALYLPPSVLSHNESLAHSGTKGASALEALPTYHQLYRDITLPLVGDLKIQFWMRWKNGEPAGHQLWADPLQDIIITLRDPANDAVLKTLFQASSISPELPAFSGVGGSMAEAFYVQQTIVIRDAQHPFPYETVRLCFDVNGGVYPMLADLDDISIIQNVTNHPPVANAGSDQTVECASPSGASVTLDGTGSTDEDNDDLTYSWTWTGGTASGATPTVTLPLGSHEITLTVDDGKGGTATDVVVVNVVDTTPPVVTLNGASEVTLECPAPYVELGAVVTDACDPNPSLDITGSVDSHTVGDYTITYTGKDASGNTTVVTRTVKVVDTTPPVISSVTATPNSLWPPNHKLVAVTVGVNASDNCGSVTSAIVGVTSSEADNGIGDGNTSDDIQNINGLSVDLRAERSGNGGGRIYTIKVRSADPSGNYAEKTVEVIVPGDNGKKH